MPNGIKTTALLPVVLLFLGVPAGAQDSDSGDAEPGVELETELEPPPPAESDLQGKPVGDVRLKGLKRTRASVIEREIQVNEGEPLDPARVEDSVRRLKNLEIFSDVDATVVPDGAGGVDIDFAIQEKWTTIPIFKIGSGGGIFYLIVGAYDVNLFGRYLEAGAQYELLGGTHSGVAWFRNPRVAGRRLRIGADIWDATRVRSLYKDGALEGAFTLRRQRLNTFVDGPVARDLTVGGGVEINNDNFSTASQTGEQRAANLVSGMTVPDGGQTFLARAYASYGRVDLDNDLVGGYLLSGTYEYSPRVGGNDFPFHRALLEAKGYFRLPLRSNLATRFVVGTTNTDALQYQFYVGGIEYTRGLLDGQARGSSFWQGNLEYRIPSVRTEWLVLQHVFFTDLGNVGSSPMEIWDMREVVCTSTGLGVRLISPRIYRAVLRVDWAIAFGPHQEMGISFGVQQFF